MPRRNPPKYCRHPNGQAYVKVRGKVRYLGKFDSDESRNEYAKVVAEWCASPETPKVAKTVSCANLSLLFMQEAREQYAHRQAERYKVALRFLVTPYGDLPVNEFSPAKPEENRGRLLWCIAVGTIAMAAFKVGNPRMFKLLGTRQCDPKEALEFLTDLIGGGHADWWFKLLLTGGGLKMGDEESANDVMTKVGLLGEDEGAVHINVLGNWEADWGDSFSSRLVQLHDKIEQISQWN